MEGGVIAKIAANGGKVPVVADLTNTTVFTSNNAASTPLKQVSNLLFHPGPELAAVSHHHKRTKPPPFGGGFVLCGLNTLAQDASNMPIVRRSDEEAG